MKKNQIISTILLGSILLVSCSNDTKLEDAEDYPKLVELPDDLTNISDVTFEPLLTMISDVKLVAVTEGTHGMNEPLDFRNELIKFLVTKKRIDVVAIESGVLESRIIFDYVNGKGGDIDSVLKGLIAGFDALPQNRTLIEWMHNYNADSLNNHKVKFYGFDISGTPTNPWIEKISTPITEALNYLELVDNPNWVLYNKNLNYFIDYLNFNADSEDNSKQYWDLTDSDKDLLTEIIDKLVGLFETNKSQFTRSSSEEDYDWGNQAIICAKQIDDYLQAMRRGNDFNYSVREKAMLDNLDWIMEREKDKNILLFAHLAHLTKDIFILDKDSVNVQPYDNFGEYLGKKFGNKYKVIGNFYKELYFPDDTIQVLPEAFAMKLGEEKYKNYYMELDKSDSTFNRNWIFGKPSSGGNVYMNPNKGVDIIFFNDNQSYFEDY